MHNFVKTRSFFSLLRLFLGSLLKYKQCRETLVPTSEPGSGGLLVLAA